MVTGMSSSAPTSPLRQLLENRISQLSVEVECLFAEARERGRREFADQLNQAVRRIRQSDNLDELGATLLDAAGQFSTGSALFLVEADTAKGERIRGVSEEAAAGFPLVQIPLSQAPALAGAAASRDPVVAVADPGEVSPELVRIAGHKIDGRVFVFPLVVRDQVPVLLYAWGMVQGSALELLAQVASGVWSELSRPEPPQLVQIAPPPPPAAAPPAPPANSWEALSPGEQQIHLRAQRFARVQVAEMRLHDAEAVTSGRAQSNLYDALRKPIDTARETFRHNFFAACSSMVDYLHLELVRTMANDDAELLGKHYPGPML